MRIVLVHPQIPPNTGNVARLCAATRIGLHLVKPLGFEISDRQLKRAGLDYWEHLKLHQHNSLQEALRGLPEERLFFFSKKAGPSYVEAEFGEDSVLVFGNETRGLPEWVFEKYADRLWRIPIFHPGVRSLNLSSAVAIAAYEALRQTGSLGSFAPRRQDAKDAKNSPAD